LNPIRQSLGKTAVRRDHQRRRSIALGKAKRPSGLLKNN
jgi:hypothetical protein